MHGLTASWLTMLWHFISSYLLLNVISNPDYFKFDLNVNIFASNDLVMV